MKKVTLLAINAKYVHSSLSVWVLAEGIRVFAKRSYDVSVVESTINEPAFNIARAVAELAPDVVCISSYIWNAHILPSVINELKACLPSAVFILGGPEAEFSGEFWLNGLADYVLAGEGEYVLPAFLDELTVWDRGTVRLSQLETDEPSPCPNSYPTTVDPYTDKFFATLRGRLAYIETSRGCPFSCAFCLSAHESVRFFPLETVFTQIQKLAMSDTKTLKFVDRTFNCNVERAYNIFEFCLNLDASCKFHFEVAADLFDERTLDLLETAPLGRFQFEIGLQSFYEPALAASSRQTALDKVLRNITRLLSGRNIHIHVDLIAGLPYETLNEFENSFDRAYNLGAHHLQLGFLKLLHGSVLRSRADELGLVYSSVAPYEIIRNPWLSESDIKILKKTENALQHTYNKGRFLSALGYVLRVSGLSPFALYHRLGESFPNHGTQLEDYACQIFDFCKELSGVVKEELTDRLLCDWLGMVKGKNAPGFLKPRLASSRELTGEYEKHFGRKYRRGEAGVLSDGSMVFVDSENRNPVTGLYRIFVVAN